jgi:hypothetical protein
MILLAWWGVMRAKWIVLIPSGDLELEKGSSMACVPKLAAQDAKHLK